MAAKGDVGECIIKMMSSEASKRARAGSDVDIPKQMGGLHDLLQKHLASNWKGWAVFSRDFGRILCEACNEKGLEGVALSRLNHRQLQGFIDSVLPSPWRHETDVSEEFVVPETIVTLMEKASAADLKKKLDEREGERSAREEARQRLEQVSHDLETMRIFLDIKEFTYEFPHSFVAVAVEIDGIPEGVEYAVQGKNRGIWVRLFGQVCHRNEIGLHQFKNALPCKAYRLVCARCLPSATPELKLYKASTDTKLFKKGVPPLLARSPAQDGYEITTSSQYALDNFGVFHGHACYNVLDDDVKHIFATAANPGTSWLQLKLPRPRVFNAVEIASRGDCAAEQAPKEFRIEASSDIEHWTRLFPLPNNSQTTVTDKWTIGERRIFAFDNQQEYLYYRVVIISCHGSPHHAISVLNFGNIAKL